MDALLTSTNGLLTILGLLLGLVIWMLKRNTDKVTSASIDIAVIKETISDVKPDHDKLTVLNYKHDSLTKDVNAAHDKIRDHITSTH